MKIDFAEAQGWVPEYQKLVESEYWAGWIPENINVVQYLRTTIDLPLNKY